MGEVILGAVWLVIGGGLVWRYIASRRRKRLHGNRLPGAAEQEHTIRESRAAGHAGINVRDGGGSV